MRTEAAIYLSVESETGFEIKSTSLFSEVTDPNHLHNIRMSEMKQFEQNGRDLLFLKLAVRKEHVQLLILNDIYSQSLRTATMKYP